MDSIIIASIEAYAIKFLVICSSLWNDKRFEIDHQLSQVLKLVKFEFKLYFEAGILSK